MVYLYLSNYGFPFLFLFFRNIWVCEACDLKFSKRETIIIHCKLHEDEFDVEKVTLTDTTCPECSSVSVRFHIMYSMT